MDEKTPHNPKRAVSIAIAGGAVVATGMMFVPVGVFERMIGATGFPELVQAAGAHFGDVARAMTAYAAGAATLLGLAANLLRGASREYDVPQPRYTAIKSLGHYRVEFLKYVSTKMPWHKEAEEIHSLSDLSRFRSVNVSADVPTRRPLFASQDLPELGLMEQPPIEIVAPAKDIEAELAATEFTEPVSLARLIECAPNAASDISTADMVAQLETAMAIRQQKRALLGTETIGDLTQVSDHGTDEAVVPIESRRPALELVSSAVVKDDEADSALAAALATLNRVTASAR